MLAAATLSEGILPSTRRWTPAGRLEHCYRLSYRSNLFGKSQYNQPASYRHWAGSPGKRLSEPYPVASGSSTPIRDPQGAGYLPERKICTAHPGHPDHSLHAAELVERSQRSRYYPAWLRRSLQAVGNRRSRRIWPNLRPGWHYGHAPTLQNRPGGRWQEGWHTLWQPVPAGC